MTAGTPQSAKARLLAAATDLVTDGGYAGATVNEICRRAGVRPPALYYHYGNKDGLVGAVAEAMADAWLDELEATVGPAATFGERLAAGLRGWRALIVAQHSPVRLLLRLQLDCADSVPGIRAALQRVTRRSRAIIANAIEGVVGPVRDVDELAQTVLSLVQGAALRHHLDHDEPGLDHRLEEIGWTLAVLVEARRVARATKEDPR
jgi:AcrR family transcriptional regulator